MPGGAGAGASRAVWARAAHATNFGLCEPLRGGWPCYCHWPSAQHLQGHRIAHWLWNNERHSLAFYFQNQMSEKFGVDIHPAAKIGQGIMFDHATGIVVGETAVIENDVTMLHGVTLGGTGKEQGDRHPKVRRGVLIGASASVIGNIEIGEGAKVGAGSVVMEDVPAQVTVAGVPAKIVGKLSGSYPSEEVDQKF